MGQVAAEQRDLTCSLPHLTLRAAQSPVNSAAPTARWPALSEQQAAQLRALRAVRQQQPHRRGTAPDMHVSDVTGSGPGARRACATQAAQALSKQEVIYTRTELYASYSSAQGAWL